MIKANSYPTRARGINVKYPMIRFLISKVMCCRYVIGLRIKSIFSLQDGVLSSDEVKKHTELFLSAAKGGSKVKKSSDGRCPHAYRRGKKAQEPKEVKKATESKDEKKSNDKDVKDEL